MFLLLLAQIGFSQITTSTLTGRIINLQGENISGVTVTLVHTGTNARLTTQTNTEGRYTLANLNPGGPYLIQVEYLGFKKNELANINLPLGPNTQNFQLEEDSKTLGEVVVRASKGKSSRANTSINADQLKTMPSISRSLQDFTRKTPQSSNNSFLGTNFRYNNVTLDGAINNDAIGFSPSLGGQGGTSGQPGSSTRTNPVSIDAIQDIQVYLAPFDVKIGNFLGGSINAVTRSGSNLVTGSVYAFGRNAAITGRNRAGDNSKMPASFHEYQTGFRLGLPLIKDKLFLFTNQEITRRQDPIILGAGSADMDKITVEQAKQIADHFKNFYGLDAGSYDNYTIFSNSNKFFNRLDWIINANHQLSIRNNTITSQATNLERDQNNFRFAGIDFKQINNQNSTVAELKSRFGNAWSNSFILGYSSIHDYRKPTADPAVPQIEIAAKGGTLFMGTDREASIFDMKQKTLELTNNLTWVKNNHTFTFGTHNEFYTINYGFVNAWNGRISYSSIDDFLNNRPNRVRTNYNYANNSRDYIVNNPPAKFNVNLYSLYAQDEIQVGNHLKLTPGIRFDLAHIPNKQPLSTKTIHAPTDPRYGTTYSYTQPKDITNNFLGQVQVSPRLGFSYDVFEDQRLIIRGGTGVFTGRIPFAWLGYAYYNNGDSYGAFDKRYSYNGDKPSRPKPGTDPIKDALTGIGEAGFVKNQGIDINDASGATQVDLIDNNFKMPQIWRNSLAVDYKTEDQWRFSVEAIYTKVIYDLQFKHINLVDNPIFMPYDVNKKQPIYMPLNDTKAINPLYTNAYLLTNTKQGYRYSLTAQVGKNIDNSVDISAAYTYGRSKDITNGIRNSMESNWQLNQALNPNNPDLAYSNFDIRNRIVSTVNYRVDWGKDKRYLTNLSLFFSAQSGQPYTLGFVNSTINGSAQNVGLAYIPKVGETAQLFAATEAGAAMAAAFDSYIDNDKYLRTRRGDFTERNGARTPWNYQADFRLAQDISFKVRKTKTHTLSLTYDILNLTNLLNKHWGIQYFAPNTFNATGNIGLQLEKAGTESRNPTYAFHKDETTSYSKDFFASRWQMQFGLRYSF